MRRLSGEEVVGCDVVVTVDMLCFLSRQMRLLLNPIRADNFPDACHGSGAIGRSPSSLIVSSVLSDGPMLLEALSYPLWFPRLSHTTQLLRVQACGTRSPRSLPRPAPVTLRSPQRPPADSH